MRKYCTGRVARRSFLEKTLLSDGATWQMIQPWMPRTYNGFSPFGFSSFQSRPQCAAKHFLEHGFNSQNCGKWPLLSSCLAVCLKRQGAHWTDCEGILNFGIFFKKSIDNNQVLLKSSNNNGYFTWRPIHIYDYICRILLIMRNIWDESCRENQNTQFDTQ